VKNTVLVFCIFFIVLVRMEELNQVRAENNNREIGQGPRTIEYELIWTESNDYEHRQ
jgi:hypothetical protein